MINDEVRSMGLHTVTIDKVISRLKSRKLPRLPKYNTVRTILRDHFGLRYKKVDAASSRYNDVTFDEKRQWISRILAQFFTEDVILISIDEANFKSTCSNDQQWLPGGQV
jgi:hypothetical protein